MSLRTVEKGSKGRQKDSKTAKCCPHFLSMIVIVYKSLDSMDSIFYMERAYLFTRRRSLPRYSYFAAVRMLSACCPREVKCCPQVSTGHAIKCTDRERIKDSYYRKGEMYEEKYNT